MIRQTLWRSNAERADGSLWFPGDWIQTWALMAGTGVWILVNLEPRP